MISVSILRNANKYIFTKNKGFASQRLPVLSVIEIPAITWACFSAFDTFECSFGPLLTEEIFMTSPGV